ncbi:MAG: ErpA-related iron-sulfur cluster insertion protein [Desulfovibrio sp.]|jgi:Fe-S cluster assembly iron-binding protein IscA|nr:ErpA-related iron-sulfur cluster insertion protein [Desulfovibrio sp.]
MHISMTEAVASKLRALLDKEGGEACVRVRESKIGCGCKSRITLRLSIDERCDDDLETPAHSVPFVINRDLADQYGENFTVAQDEHQAFTVAPA